MGVGFSSAGRRMMVRVAGIALVLGVATLGGVPAVAQAQQDCAAISALTLTSDTPGVLDVSWEAPTGAAPTDYRVNWALSDEDYPSWTDNTANLHPTTTSQQLTDLDEGVEYKVRVRARYHDGARAENPCSGPWAEATRQVAAQPSSGVRSDDEPPVALEPPELAVIEPDDPDVAPVALQQSADGSVSEPANGVLAVPAILVWRSAAAQDSGICGRTEIVRDAILRKLPDVSACSDVTGTHLASITGEMIMLDNGTITLQDGDFEGLSNLDVLYLHYNDLSSIPEDALDGLTGLEELFLYNNTLTTLPGDVFDDLSNLEELHLSHNRLSSLPADVFDGLSNLEELYLEYNSLASLPDGIFDDLSALRVLNLTANSLTGLDGQGFEHLGALQGLFLAGNGLAGLPGEVFDGLTDLQTLHLYSNELSEFPDGLFTGLSNLRTLVLHSNPGAPFTFVAELEPAGGSSVAVSVDQSAPFAMTVTLTAEGATLSAASVTVPAGSNRSEAVTVDLDGSTGTVSVQSASFAGTQNADIRTGLGQALSLPAGLGEALLLPADICDRTQQVQDAILAKLADISDCAAVTAEHLTAIPYLYLGHKGISALQSGDFDGLTNLETLNLYRNSLLSALPEDVFDGLTSLKTLNLSRNSLSALPEDVFDGLTNLESLSTAQNSLSALPEDVFDGLTSLKTLGLFNNSLSALPEDVFDGLTNLESLDLSYNRLSELPAGVFDGLSSLKAMWMAKVGLSALPEDVFDGLTNLETLWMVNNGWSALPEDVFDGLTNLKGLYLYSNSLSALPEDVFDGLSSLEQLDLYDNLGSPFTFSAELAQEGTDAVVVNVTEGAPFDMVVGLSAEGGSLSATTVTIDGGTRTSEAILVTPTGDGPAQVTISVESAAFEGVTWWSRVGDKQWHKANNFKAGLGESLTATFAAPNSPATGAPTISGTAQVSQTLTANTSGIADADGLTNVTYSYQWLAGRDTVIGGATSSTYTLEASDVDEVITVRVTFTDDAGNEESLTSAATAAVIIGGL